MMSERGNKRFAIYARILGLCAQLLTVVVFPLVLSPKLYVEYNLIVPLSVLSSTILFGWMNGALYRWIHKVTSPNYKQLRFSVVSYYVFIILLALVSSLSLFFVFIDSYYFLIPLVVISLAIKDGTNKLSNAYEDYKRFFYGYLYYVGGKLCFVAIIWKYEVRDVFTMLVIFMVSELFFAGPFYKDLNSLIYRVPKKPIKILKILFNYGMPLIFASLAGWVIALSDRYVLSFFVNTADVANYILTYQFASNAFVVPMSFFMTLYFPKLLRMEKEVGLKLLFKENSKVMRRYLLLAPFAVIVLFFIIREVITTFYVKYDCNELVLGFVLISQAIFTVNHFLNKKFELRNRTFYIAAIYLIGGLTNIIVNFGIIPTHGVLGASIATLISSLTVVLLLVIVSRLKGATD